MGLWIVKLIGFCAAEVVLTTALVRWAGPAWAIGLYIVPAVIGLAYQATQYRHHAAAVQQMRKMQAADAERLERDEELGLAPWLVVNYWIATALLLVPGVLSHVLAFVLLARIAVLRRWLRRYGKDRAAWNVTATHAKLSPAGCRQTAQVVALALADFILTVAIVQRLGVAVMLMLYGAPLLLGCVAVFATSRGAFGRYRNLSRRCHGKGSAALDADPDHGAVWPVTQAFMTVVFLALPGVLTDVVAVWFYGQLLHTLAGGEPFAPTAGGPKGA